MGWWRRSAIDDRIAFALFATLAILAIAIFRDYGISWDEPLHDRLGRAAVAWYASGLAKPYAPPEQQVDLYYGNLFDIGRILLSRLSPVGAYETGHLLSALVGLVGIVGCWRLSRLLFGPRAALASALLLALTPSWFGHLFINPKDIPFAAGYVWSLYCLVRCLESVPVVPWRRAVALGIALGLTLAIKVPAVVLCLYGLVGVPSALYVRRRPTAAGAALARETAVAYARLFLPVVLVAYPIMLAFWPWAQSHPIANPLWALFTFAHFPAGGGRVLVDGVSYAKMDIPRSYLPIHLAIKLPEITLLAAAVGASVAMFWARQRWRAGDQERLVQVAVVAMATFFPVIYQVARRATEYDEIRHVLFIVPPLAVLLGPVLARGFDGLMRQSAALRSLGLAVVAAFVLYHVSLLVRLHPYEYIYYNALAGGVPGAEGRFNLDYWMTHRREAIGRLSAWLAADGQGERRVAVKVCRATEAAVGDFPPNFRPARREEAGEFALVPSRSDFPECAPPVDARRIAVISRMGVVLGEVVLIPAPAPVGAAQPPVAR
jgi:hypothetical protein